MRNTLKACLVAGALAVPGAAMSAVFDFESMADAYKSANGGKEATYDQMVAFNSGFFTDAGISITGISATGTGLHGFFDGGRAGLGVCSTASRTGSSISGCSSKGGVDAGDDNVTKGEGLTIEYDSEVSMTSLFFRNATHPPLKNGSLDINGVSVTTDANGMLSAAVLASLGSAKVWQFDFTGDEFYVASATVAPIPLPAGVLLLGTALGGLGVMRRRKKASA